MKAIIKIWLILSAMLSLGLMPCAYANKDHLNHDPHEHEQHRHHGAHVHGSATLDLVLDKHELMIHLKSPLVNLLGFEHQPASEQQKQIYQAMLQQLDDMQTLMTVHGSQCQMESVELSDSFTRDTQAGHADLEASYFFNCEHPDKMIGITINLFDHFPYLETLQVQMITPAGQQQLELTSHQSTLQVN